SAESWRTRHDELFDRLCDMERTQKEADVKHEKANFYFFVNLGEIEARNHVLRTRLDEATVLIESLNGEKSNLEQEVRKRVEESSEALRQLDTVRRRLEDMERSREKSETVSGTQRLLQQTGKA
ncbi:hypothetical protein PMAYCL1PPCAC_04186, partial [Pristionchus mayeri]